MDKAQEERYLKFLAVIKKRKIGFPLKDLTNLMSIYGITLDTQAQNMLSAKTVWGPKQLEGLFTGYKDNIVFVTPSIAKDPVFKVEDAKPAEVKTTETADEDSSIVPKSLKFIQCLTPRVGDLMQFHIMHLNHPAIVLKVKGDILTICILSSTYKPHICIQEVKSRILSKPAYFTSTILQVDVKHYTSNFICPIDHQEQIPELKRNLKDFYAKLF